MNDNEAQANYRLIATDAKGQVVVERIVAAEQLRQIKKIYLEEGLKVEASLISDLEIDRG